jgi:hypothetical protein
MKQSLVLSVFMLISSLVFAGPKVTVYGGGTYSLMIPSSFTNPPAQGRLGYPVGGLAVELPMGKKFGLVLDGSYFTRAFNTAAFGDISHSSIQAELRVNFWLTHFLSIGVGGFGSYLLDPMRRTGGATMTLAAYGIRNMDYGLVASLGFQIPISAKLGFTTGAKYHYGLANLATAAGSRLQFSDFQ